MDDKNIHARENHVWRKIGKLFVWYDGEMGGGGDKHGDGEWVRGSQRGEEQRDDSSL